MSQSLMSQSLTHCARKPQINLAFPPFFRTFASDYGNDIGECHSAVAAAAPVVTAGVSDGEGSLSAADREHRCGEKGEAGRCLVAAPCG